MRNPPAAGPCTVRDRRTVAASSRPQSHGAVGGAKFIVQTERQQWHVVPLAPWTPRPTYQGMQFRQQQPRLPLRITLAVGACSVRGPRTVETIYGSIPPLPQPFPTATVTPTVRESRTVRRASGCTCHLRRGPPQHLAGIYCPWPTGMGRHAWVRWMPGSATRDADFAASRGEGGILGLALPTHCVVVAMHHGAWEVTAAAPWHMMRPSMGWAAAVATVDDPGSPSAGRCPLLPRTHVRDLPWDHMVQYQYGSLGTVNRPAGGVMPKQRPPLTKWHPQQPRPPVPDLPRNSCVHCPRVADSGCPPTCHPMPLLPTQCAVHANWGALEVARPWCAGLSMASCELVPCAACRMRCALCSAIALLAPPLLGSAYLPCLSWGPRFPHGGSHRPPFPASSACALLPV